MKKRLFFIVMLEVLSIGQVLASSYQAKLTATVATGKGQVYVGSTNSTPSSYSTTSTASNFDAETKVPFYLFAKPGYGYQFAKWTTDADDIVTIKNPTESNGAEAIVISETKEATNPQLGNVYANFEVYSKVSNVEFLKTEGLSKYTVVGPLGYPAVTPGKIVPTHDNYELKITAQALDGYGFYRWFVIDAQGKMSYFYDEYATITKTFTEDTKIGAEFKAGYFITNNEYYVDIDEAFDAAKFSSDKMVYLVSDYTLEGVHTIPEGVTLLIPFDADNTYYNDVPEMTCSYSKPTAYKTLTMSKGASLIVNGNLNVSAKITAGNGGSEYAGAVAGPYGHIKMSEGSSVILKEGSNLFAWGYITGDGNVIAESGSCVYEDMQFVDFRGGAVCTEMAGNEQKVFPFSQYYVQNIEASLTLQYGATEKLLSSVAIGSGEKQKAYGSFGKLVCPDVDSEPEDEGLFTMYSGSITKSYDPTTDRVKYVLDGAAAKIGSLSVTLNATEIGTMTVTSSDYVLPITNNMSVVLRNGTKLSTDNDVAMLAGSELVIDKESELIIGTTKAPEFYVYDRDEWISDNFAFQKKFKPVVYSPTRKYSRTEDDLVDAKIDLNGIITVNGQFYTTKSGANIVSSASTGSIIYNANAGTKANTYQFTQIYLVSGSNVPTTEYVEIPVTPAYLLNADGNYVETSVVKFGESFYIDNGVWHHSKRVGDVNMDGRIDIKDIVTLVNIINGKSTDTFGNADANEDGKVDAEDVKVLEKLILWK